MELGEEGNNTEQSHEGLKEGRRAVEQAAERSAIQQREEERLAREKDEKLIKGLEEDVLKAVKSLFLVLCGTADGDDKFTGMQRDMSLELCQTVRPAYEAGKAAGDRALKREEFRWKKAMERQRAEMKRQGDAIKERIEAGMRERVASMEEEFRARCETFAAHAEPFEHDRGELERLLAEANQEAVRANGSAAAAETAMEGLVERLDRAEEEKGGLGSRVEELHARLLEYEAKAAVKPEGEQDSDGGETRWKEDFARVERRLEEEIVVRLAAQEDAKAAREKARLSDQALRDALQSNAPSIPPQPPIRRSSESCEEDSKLAKENARLRDKLSKLERQRSEEQARHEREMLYAGQEVQNERNARAFAETVSTRLEQELVAQSRHLLKKMGLLQTSSAKNKISRHGGKPEYRDFSSDLERLAPSGKGVYGDLQQTVVPMPPPGGVRVPGTLGMAPHPPRLNLGKVLGSGGDVAGGGGTGRTSRHAKAIHTAAPFSAR